MSYFKMDNWPLLAICILTYQRTEYALRTIDALSEHLDYEPRGWYIADDGSKDGHISRLISELKSLGETIIGYHSQRFSPRTGIGWNKGLGVCYQHSDYVMLLEDDWVLSGNFDMNPDNHPGQFNVNPYICGGKFNIRPYIEMLSECDGIQTNKEGRVNPNVGLVRLGGAAVGSTVKIVGHAGHHYLHYLKQDPYAYSGNPQIRHARFIHAYGWYSEDDKNPGELELEYDWRFRQKEGPEIWRVFDIPGWGIFHHIGEKRYR